MDSREHRALGGHTRRVTLSESRRQHLIEAIRAWPLVAPMGPLLTIARDSKGKLSPEAERHWKSFVQKTRNSGLSIRELKHLRDHAWFEHDAGSVHRGLLEHLSGVARNSIRSVGMRMEPFDPQHPSQDPRLAVVRWRWQSLELPVDLWVALAWDEAGDPPSSEVGLVPRMLARRLESGIAETHLHQGAALSFAHLWSGLAGGGANWRPQSRLKSLGPVPFCEPAGERERSTTAAQSDPLAPFTQTVLATLCVRLLLATWLWRRGSGGAGDAWRVTCAHAQRVAGHDIHQTLRALSRPANERPALMPSVAALRIMYRRLVGADRRSERQGQDASTLERCDPLARWIHPQPHLGEIESRFVSQALDAFRQSPEPEAHGHFLWYLHARVQVFRFLTLESGTPGLDWFGQYSGRLSAIRPPRIRSLAPALAHALGDSEVPLRALELRISPPPDRQHLLQDICRLANAGLALEQQARLPLELGFVVHFQKPHQASEASPRKRARFAKWYRKNRISTMAIEASLRSHPQILLLLRGLDVASRELTMPLWPFIPLFERLRRASEEAAVRLARTHPSWAVRPFYVTCHAGEEYRRLSEGVRRMFELVEFGVLRAEDRIGHGLALGDDPGAPQHAAVTMQPREERLDDLLWEIDLRENHQELAVDSARGEAIRREAYDLGRQLYGVELTVEALVQSRRMRHDPILLGVMGYPSRLRVDPNAPLAQQLLYRYLTDEAVFFRGQTPKEVHPTASEEVFLRRTQHWLRERLASLHVTIESNPSSNLLIGDLQDFQSHPVFQLQPLDPHCSEPSPVCVSINSDDPITFATNLGDEIGYLFHALVGEGVSREEASSWIQRVVNHGVRSRFTLPASARPEVLAHLA